MSLAEGLTSALSTFTTIRDENRRSQLHDLKVERYGLMNEGSRMDNKFYRETYDDRAGKISADRSRADELAAIDASRREVQEYLAPHQKREGVADANLAEAKVGTEAQRGRYWASTANEQIRSEDANVDRAYSMADEAATRADMLANQDQRERFERSSEQLREMILNAGDSTAALADPRIKGRLIGNAEALYGDALRDGQHIADFAEVAPGQYAMLDNNGKAITVGRMSVEEEEAAGASEEERRPLILTKQQLLEGGMTPEHAGAVLSRDANVSQAVQPAIEQGAARLGSLADRREDTVGAAASNAERFQGAQEYQQQRDQLEEKAEILQQQMDALEDTGGQVGGQVRQGFTSRRDALRDELAALDARAEEAGFTQFVNEDGVVDEDLYTQAQRERSQTLSALDQDSRIARQQVQRNRQDTLRAFVANPEAMGTDLSANTRATGQPGMTVEQFKGGMTIDTEQVKLINGAIDEVFEPFDTQLAAIPTKGGNRAEQARDYTRARRSVEGAVAKHEVLQRLMTGSTNDRLKARSLLSIAANGAIESGKDAETMINGLVANRSTRAIDVGSTFANDEGFTSDISDEVRFKAVERAMDAVERGESTGEAKRAAMSWAKAQ